MELKSEARDREYARKMPAKNNYGSKATTPRVMIFSWRCRNVGADNRSSIILFYCSTVFVLSI